MKITQFYNVPLNFASLPRERRALTIGAHNLAQNNEKRICFHKIYPIMIPKSIGYKISTIFLFSCVRDKMTKTDTSDLMKCASKVYF